MVAIKDGPGLMSAQTHRDFFGYAGRDHVSHCATPQIMDHEPVVNFLGRPSLADLLKKAQANTDAGVLPCLAKIPDWLAVVMKDKGAVRLSTVLGPLKDLHKFPAERQHALLLVLAVFSAQPDRVDAYASPLQGLHFA